MAGDAGVSTVPEMSDDPRIRVFRREFERMEVDAYVVVTERYVVVLDTLLCPEDAAQMMQTVQHELKGRAVLAVNSHADWDHAWGNGYFTGEHFAPIIAQEYGLVRFKSEETAQELADFQRDYPLFRSVTLNHPTITFQSNLAIHGGNLTLELLPAPGHRTDHIAAWIPELLLLFAFDAVETPLPCIDDAISAPYMFATLEQFLTLNPRRVLCSHGKSTGVETIQENLAYLREIEKRCHELLATHRPTETELERSATLINYPFEYVVAGRTETIDREFYSRAHNDNVRYIMQWLMS